MSAENTLADSARTPSSDMPLACSWMAALRSSGPSAHSPDPSIVRERSILTTSRSYQVTWATRSFADSSPSAPGLSASPSSTRPSNSSQPLRADPNAADEVALLHRDRGPRLD